MPPAPRLYWISSVPSRLAIMGRPRGGEWLCDEIRSLRREGVDVVISLLTSQEVTELDLADEAAECAKQGITFRFLPIADRGVPESRNTFRPLINEVLADLDGGRAVAIHCRAGIGRSAMVAACLLALKGEDVDQAFDRIAKARGCPVPDTPEQRAWVDRAYGGSR